MTSLAEIKYSVASALRRSLNFERHVQCRLEHAQADLDGRQLLLDKYADAVHLTKACNSDELPDKVGKYLVNCCLGEYKFSYHVGDQYPLAYASMYALLTKSILGEKLAENDIIKWGTYLDSFQSDDGLFRDPLLINDDFESFDWWGAKHLTLHAITCYSLLNRKPPKRFSWIEDFYDADYVVSWLKKLDWSMCGDADNAIMNVMGMLQFSRDVFGETSAAKSIDIITAELFRRFNRSEGCWWEGPLAGDKHKVSRACQVAYHIWTPLLYDANSLMEPEKLIDIALLNQNRWGGFAPHIESSACEDIDSIYLLMQASKATRHRENDVEIAASRYLIWALANMNDDGGFVFYRNKPFFYGHELMSSEANQSSMFATWFRMLSIAYTFQILQSEERFSLNAVPGFGCA